MKKQIVAANLFWLILLPLSWGESVAAHGTLGMLDAQLVTGTMDPVGTVNIWNTNRDFNLIVTPNEGYLLSKVFVFINPNPPPPPAVEGEKNIEPNFGQWPYITKYKKEPSSDPFVLKVSFEEDLDFPWGHWGQRWLDERFLTVGIRVELKSTDLAPVTITAWAFNPNLEVDGQRCGWDEKALAMRYEIRHPQRGKFFPGPIKGLQYGTRTQGGVLGIEEDFFYFPGEMIIFNIGNVEIGYAQAGPTISPLDIFISSDPSDPPVANLVRLLQSLDGDGESNATIDITQSAPLLEDAMGLLNIEALDFTDSDEITLLIAKIVDLSHEIGLSLAAVSTKEAIASLEQASSNLMMRRKASKSPEYATDKPKLDIMPMWVPAKRADGTPAKVTYRNHKGKVVQERNMVKPLLVSYTEEQDSNPEWGIARRGSDVVSAISLDDGETWRRFNVSRMAGLSSFKLRATGEKFPGNSRGPRQKIEGNKILIVWTSAYARGGNPSFSIKTDDAYPHDDDYAVNDVWGAQGRQGSVNYDEDDTVGDQGIGEIPYYALWTCRGMIDSDGTITWFQPERLTSGRRDAFYPVISSAKGAGFAITWQEDPGGLRPGQCLGDGSGWSGATVHKKTDIWYSYLRLSDFAKIDINFISGQNDSGGNGEDEHGEDGHGEQPDIASRPKWLVPMSLPVRVSDNNAVNTQNLKVELDELTGLPLIGEDGNFIPLPGAEEADHVASEHETEGGCGGDEGGEDDGHDDHDGQAGTGGGWGMARYAYMLPDLPLADKTDTSTIWDGTVDGEYRPEDSNVRWYRFLNKPGVTKTVVVTADGRVLDGDTGACRPTIKLVPSGTPGGAWAILGYEETKGLGTPPEGDHEDEEEHVDRPEPDDSGKNLIYHSFPFDQPDMVSAGQVVNLPALDDDRNLIPIYYKDAAGESTGIFRQYKTENSRRVRFLAQPLSSMKKAGADTIMVALYKQGREGQGKPSDIFAIRVVVPEGEEKRVDLNPFRFENFVRLDESDPNPDANGNNRYQRRHMNLSGTTVEAIDPLDIAEDDEGNSWGKVSRWSQFEHNLFEESFDNPYSEAKGHRGFIRGKKVVIGYSQTPNWGRRGGDHLDFFVRRSFDGGRSYTTNPAGNGTTHTTIARDTFTGRYKESYTSYGAGEFEPARNLTLLVGNSQTITDPRLVPPMGTSLVGSTPDGYSEDTPDSGIFYAAFGIAEVHRDTGVQEIEAANLSYTRTTDGGETWSEEPWLINPDSIGTDTGEMVYRRPTLAQGTAHQGHSQIRMHPSGNRLYAIWHQWADEDDMHLTPFDLGDEILFRRIDFMDSSE